MKGWIEKWAPKETYAGVEGRGAEDGWMAKAVMLEEAAIEGHDNTAGAVDMMKCFDQFQKILIYELARRAGMPEVQLQTCRACQESLTASEECSGRRLG